MKPVLIIGVGVSGLTIAQGLRLHSIPFRLFERRPNSLNAQGHRFRLSKEALTAIRSVLSPELQTLFDETAAQSNQFKPRYVDAQEFRFDPPVRVEDEDSKPVDRSWLRALLMLGIEDSIEYSKDFESYQIIDSEHVQVHFTDGTSANGSLLIGADGVSSKVRNQLQPHRRLLDLERTIMWGRTPLTPSLQVRLSADTLSWYMVSDSTANVQAVIEPMIFPSGQPRRFENYIYWVFSTPSAGDDTIPKTAAERKDLLDSVTETWHAEVQLVLRSAPCELSSCVPVLSSGPDIELLDGEQEQSALNAAAGMVTLVGDAAHAMSPMGGSGASTAVVNAADLVETICGGGSLRGFERRMAERARVKIEHSFEGGKKFWKGREWFEYRHLNETE